MGDTPFVAARPSEGGVTAVDQAICRPRDLLMIIIPNCINILPFHYVTDVMVR